MSSLYPIIFTILIATVWLAASIQNAQLYRAFIKKHPEEAKELIPYAFNRIRHPEKFIFFFRQKSLPILKSDSHLWRLRQRLKMLVIISVALPIACMAILVISALIGL